jgi:hypothetical protein
LAENNDAPDGIDPIPTTTKFLVFDSDPKIVRDALVTIVLPNQGALPDLEIFEPTNHYRCTYPPYDPFLVPPG